MEQRITAEALEQLVREHAALQRVATLVARQREQAEIFAGVTREAGLLLAARMTFLLRIESAETAVIVAGWSRDETPVPVGSRGVLDGTGLVGRIVCTGRPVRLEDFDEVGGAVAAQMRALDSLRRRRADRPRRPDLGRAVGNLARGRADAGRRGGPLSTIRPGSHTMVWGTI